ncbi:MAG TPA: hypothetical protein VJU82_10925 [Acidobacteriaceae bacterium]|nr:hypothetical protein [Acidobacteriaceae bacterium]
MISPLEDLYQTRTNRDRKGTIPDRWNDALLQRDLERLISEGLVERLTNIREIPPDLREKNWYQEVATGNLYVYIDAWDRGGPEFRRYYPESAARRDSDSIQ